MKEKHVILTAEARLGIRKKHSPSASHLLRMLQGTDEKDMPTSEQVRWMAFNILCNIRRPGTKMGKYTFSTR